jgi:hypothetical protein
MNTKKPEIKKPALRLSDILDARPGSISAQPESITAVIARFTEAAGALYAHPKCPAELHNWLGEFAAESFSLANLRRLTPQQEADLYSRVLAVNLESLAGVA